MVAKVDFHQRTLDLLSQPELPLDFERGAAVERAAAAVGITLPRSVVEWYCVPEESALWQLYKGEHYPVVWLPKHDGYKRQVQPSKLYEPRQWIKAPIVSLQHENQGCWSWGVVLDGTADPPAVISFDGDTWDICAESFSMYVYSIIFDNASYGPGSVGKDFRIEECVHGEQRRMLRKEFRLEPTTRGAGCLARVFTERFSGSDQRFSFVNLDEHRFSLWRICAGSESSFEGLVGRLSRIVPAVEQKYRT